MENTNTIFNFYEYGDSFEKLQTIAYKDITINRICIRVLGIHFVDYGVDWYVRKHKHSFFEFHYVTDNNVYTTVNNIEHNIRTGCFYILPPGTYHSHRQDTGTRHIGFVLRWEFIKEHSRVNGQKDAISDLERAAKYLADAHSFPVQDDGSLMKGMKYLLEMTGTSCGLLELQMAFCQMVMRIGRFYSAETPDIRKEVNYSFLENRMISSAIKFIEENYNQELDVHDISSSVHLSYSHLSRLFKKYTGETVNSYLNTIRLGKSQVLLVCSDKSIAQIAREVGFSSENYFCSAFRKAFSISPSNYRKAKGSLSDQ